MKYEAIASIGEISVDVLVVIVDIEVVTYEAMKIHNGQSHVQILVVRIDRHLE